MSPSRPFILRPVATVLFMVAILLVGMVAYQQLPVSALPQVDYPTIQVQTFYPGARPDVMASSVTSPLERQFGQIPGLDANDFEQLRRLFDHHVAVCVGSRHRCRYATGSSGHQRGDDVSAERSAESADLYQDESRRCADSDARSDLGHVAADQGPGSG